MPKWNTVTHAEIQKIDSATTDGLSGVNNSLAYRIGEVERHFHSYEKWFGLAASPSGETHRADRIAAGIAAFQLDAGNNTWGAWVQIYGSTDATAKYDMHRLMITDVERDAAIHFVQLAFGESGAAALSAGTYTEFVYKPQATNTEETPLEVQCRRQAIGTKAWARVLASGSDTGTLDFYFGLHEYEG